MPMGLCNAADTFQSLLNAIFGNMIYIFIVVNLDDGLIYRKSCEEQFEQLELVLPRLHENNLYVGTSRCQLITTKTEFLGLQLGVYEIEIGEDRKKKIKGLA